MSQTSLHYIYEQVAAVLRAGGAVDICQLSQRIQPVCEGMQLSEIEVLVAQPSQSFAELHTGTASKMEIPHD